MTPLSRLEAAHAEFQRVAAETLQMLAEDQIQSLERQAKLSAATRAAIAECNRVLEGLSHD